jgi:hypothetical protein
MRFLFGLLILGVSVAAYTQAAQQPFTITISADEPTVNAGSDVYINIKQTNTADHVVNCGGMNSNGMDRSYVYYVLDENGKSIEKPGEHHEFRGASPTFCNLATGESVAHDVILSRLYDFTKPGTYTIQVSRYSGNDKEGAIMSNIITITVMAPAAAAPK